MENTAQTPAVTTADLPGQPYEILGPVSSTGFNIRGEACDRAFEKGLAAVKGHAAAK